MMAVYIKNGIRVEIAVEKDFTDDDQQDVFDFIDEIKNKVQSNG